MYNTLISIIIPTYNRAHLIFETLDSIISQTYKNWECIIIDDGSTDNTEEVVGEYLEKDNRFQFHHRPGDRPKGGNAARNYGFELSKGKYINWFDSDDLMTPLFLEDKIKVFLSNPEFDAVICPGAYFTDLKEPLDYTKEVVISENPVFDFVKSDLFFGISSPLWNKHFLKDKELFDEHRIKIQDIDFHFKMLLTGINFIFLKGNYNLLIRRTPNSISKSVITEEKLRNVFDYHCSTYFAFPFINDDIRIQYKEYTSKKVFQSYYQLLKYNNSLYFRLKIFKKNRRILENVIYVSSKNKLHRIKRFFVIFFITIFGIGFKYID